MRFFFKDFDLSVPLHPSSSSSQFRKNVFFFFKIVFYFWNCSSHKSPSHWAKGLKVGMCIQWGFRCICLGFRLFSLSASPCCSVNAFSVNSFLILQFCILHISPTKWAIRFKFGMLIEWWSWMCFLKVSSFQVLCVISPAAPSPPSGFLSNFSHFSRFLFP